MKLHIDLSGSFMARDDLDLLADAQQVIIALLNPDADLDRAGRDRLATLLRILDELRIAVLQAASLQP